MASTSIGFDSDTVKVIEPPSSANVRSLIVNVAVSSSKIVYVELLCVVRSLFASPTVTWLPVMGPNSMVSLFSTRLSLAIRTPSITWVSPL